jgi:hypothetical protein
MLVGMEPQRGSFDERTHPWPTKVPATAKVDVDHNMIDGFLKTVTRNGLTYDVISMEGPGGGNPHVAIHGVNRSHVKRFLLTHYDPDMIDEDFDLYCAVAA